MRLILFYSHEIYKWLYKFCVKNFECCFIQRWFERNTETQKKTYKIKMNWKLTTNCIKMHTAQYILQWLTIRALLYFDLLYGIAFCGYIRVRLTSNHLTFYFIFSFFNSTSSSNNGSRVVLWFLSSAKNISLNRIKWQNEKLKKKKKQEKLNENLVNASSRVMQMVE